MSSAKTTVMLLTFGDNLNYHSQANFCLLTALKFLPKETQFAIYTDRPDYYHWAQSWVDIRHTPKEKLTEWEGEHKFFWRVKIMAMLDAAKKDLNNLIYVDTDTIFTGPAESLIQGFSEDKSFMHLKENTLSSDKAEDKALMWNQVKNRSYSNILINEQTYMWNAGVVGLSEKNKLEQLEKALKINDEMLKENVTRRLIEQFSLSLALDSKNKLSEAKNCVLHYWGNKEEWSQKINNFFSKSFQFNWKLEEMVEKININEWKVIPISRSRRGWNRRLLKIAENYFPDRIEKH